MVEARCKMGVVKIAMRVDDGQTIVVGFHQTYEDGKAILQLFVALPPVHILNIYHGDEVLPRLIGMKSEPTELFYGRAFRCEIVVDAHLKMTLVSLCCVEKIVSVNVSVAFCGFDVNVFYIAIFAHFFPVDAPIMARNIYAVIARKRIVLHFLSTFTS